jgi:hypothetical protein
MYGRNVIEKIPTFILDATATTTTLWIIPATNKSTDNIVVIVLTTLTALLNPK